MQKIDGKQIRAARALLGWNIERLSAESLVSKATILRWEMGAMPRAVLATAVVNTLLAAGVELVDGGVRPRSD